MDAQCNLLESTVKFASGLRLCYPFSLGHAATRMLRITTMSSARRKAGFGFSFGPIAIGPALRSVSKCAVSVANASKQGYGVRFLQRMLQGPCRTFQACFSNLARLTFLKSHLGPCTRIPDFPRDLCRNWNLRSCSTPTWRPTPRVPSNGSVYLHMVGGLVVYGIFVSFR